MAMCYTDVSQRGMGFTTLQMKCAPKGAYFLVKGNFSYYDSLRKELGRGDLKLMDPYCLTRGAMGKFVGSIKEIIIDHSVLLNPQQIEILKELRTMMRSQWAGM